MKNKTKILSFLFYLLWFGVKSQTLEQARSFVNRTHIAIAKVEKEMFKSAKNDFALELKKAMKYQTIAIKMHKDGNASKAVGYSYKARVISLELLNTLSKQSVEALDLNDDEKLFCKPSEYSNLNNDLIDKTTQKKIEDLDVLDVLKFREIELSIK
jgi:hypothetical protein